MKDYLTLRAGFGGHDAMRDKAKRAFGDLVKPSRAAIQESATAYDATPVRKFKEGGKIKNEELYKGRLSQSVRPDGKHLYKEGGVAGKADKSIDKYLEHGLYGRKKGGKVK